MTAEEVQYEVFIKKKKSNFIALKVKMSKV